MADKILTSEQINDLYVTYFNHPFTVEPKDVLGLIASHQGQELVIELLRHAVFKKDSAMVEISDFLESLAQLSDEPITKEQCRLGIKSLKEATFPFVITDHEMSSNKRLHNIEQAIREFHFSKGATAEQLVAWLESTTHFILEEDGESFEIKP